MKHSVRAILANFLTLLAGRENLFAQTTSDSVYETLYKTAVSRAEYGADVIDRDLTNSLSLPLGFALTSSFEYDINEHKRNFTIRIFDGRSVVEPQSIHERTAEAARSLCVRYIWRIKNALSISNQGVPVAATNRGYPASRLSYYFRAEDPLDPPDFFQALDRMTKIYVNTSFLDQKGTAHSSDCHSDLLGTTIDTK